MPVCPCGGSIPCGNNYPPFSKRPNREKSARSGRGFDAGRRAWYNGGETCEEYEVYEAYQAYEAHEAYEAYEVWRGKRARGGGRYGSDNGTDQSKGRRCEDDDGPCAGGGARPSGQVRADDTLAGLYEALRGDAAAADVIQATRQGVDLVASSLDLSAADMEFTRVGREYLLRGLCDAVAASYDHIIVDCPPALGVLTLNALTAADDMVIPVGLEVFSLQGLKQLFNTVENVRRYCNPRLTVAGILITRRGNRASLTRELIDVIGQTAKDLNVYLYPTVIREAVAVREAQVMQESLFDSHPKAAVTADYAAFVADYLRQEDEKHGD